MNEIQVMGRAFVTPMYRLLPFLRVEAARMYSCTFGY